MEARGTLQDGMGWSVDLVDRCMASSIENKSQNNYYVIMKQEFKKSVHAGTCRHILELFPPDMGRGGCDEEWDIAWKHLCDLRVVENALQP